jgi:hypothetical protein
LLIHKLAEWRIEKIYDRNNKVLDLMKPFFHWPAKIRVESCSQPQNGYFCPPSSRLRRASKKIKHEHSRADKNSIKTSD